MSCHNRKSAPYLDDTGRFTARKCGLLGLDLELEGIIAQLIDLEAVGLVFFVVKGFQLVEGELVELIEVVPPLIARAKFGI